MTSEAQFEMPGQTPDPRADDPGYVPGVTYDRWGRYLLPSPGGDPESLSPCTRMTTLVGTLTGNEGLRIWTERELMRGIGRRSDLRAMLAADPESVKTHDEVRALASEAAGMKSAAGYGSAFHRVMERWATDVDDAAGMIAGLGDEQLGRDVRAATACLEREGIEVHAVEQLVIHETLGYAGRLDTLVTVTSPDGGRVVRVLDYKTGKVSDAGKRMVIGAQLAGYVSATHTYDPATRAFSALSGIDRETGYVLHVRDGVAQLYEVDLIAGWRDVLLAHKLHSRRRESTTMVPVGERVDAADLASSDAVPLTSPQSSATRRGEERGAAIVGDLTPDLSAEPEAASAEPEVERSPSGRAKRRCSICRQPGHTAKKCPNREGASGEAQSAQDAAVDLGIDGDDHGMPGGDAARPAAPTSIEEMLSVGATCQGCGNGWTHPDWAGRADLFVCAGCGWPSRATLDRVRGERSGLDRLRTEPASPQSPTPPWADEVGTYTLDGELPAPTLDDLIDACQTQAELAELWQRHSAEWTQAHTMHAQACSCSLPPS